MTRAIAIRVKAMKKVLEASQNVLANGEVIEDPRMGMTTDCVAIPIDDFIALGEALEDLRKKL
jgi:hypothetical protein